MPVSFKPIKAELLNIDSVFNEIEAGANDVADLMLKDYYLGVADWEHDVQFEKQVVVNPNGGVSIIIDTDDEIYFFVHEGTGPHPIKARKAERLAFPSGYKAKTKPGQIKSMSGGPFGETVFRDSVWHPGTDGRYFSRPIKEKWDPYFGREMARRIEVGLKKEGHTL